ncbi:MAG TPA: hypothetical protein VFJ19_06525 [Nocardioidaceae bacterium]|nr:hypothetical protein [Nocardioidaceae bacterium]
MSAQKPRSRRDGEEKRRRRRAEVFGDVLPDQTRDDRDPADEQHGTAERAESARDAWLRRQVPPHHGR